MCNKINIKLYLAIDRNEFCAPRVLFRIVSIAARPLARSLHPCAAFNGRAKDRCEIILKRSFIVTSRPRRRHQHAHAKKICFYYFGAQASLIAARGAY